MSEDATLDDFVSESESEEQTNDDEVSVGELQQLEQSPIDSWELVRLGEILSLEYGDNLPSGSREQGTVPVYGSNGQVDTHNEAAVDSPGIVLGRKGSIGEIRFSDKPFWPIDTTYYITHGETSQNLRFLYYLLQNIQLERLNAASAIPGLNRNDTYGLNAIVPPLSEQRKIAAILYNLDQAIQKTGEIIEQVEQLKKGIAQEIIHTGIENSQTKSAWMGEIPSHWEVKEFSELIDFSQNGIYKESEDYGGPYPIIKMGDIFGGVTLDEPIAERVHLEDDEVEKYATAKGDLVFARHAQAGWGAGDCTYVPDLDETAVIESNMVQVRLNKDVDPLFYAQYFNSEIGVKSIKRITTTGNIKSISQGDLMNLKVPIPPIDEQEEIAKVLSVFDEQAEQSESEVARLRRLKQGLMQDLLSGTVRTTDTNIEVPDEIAQHG